MICLNIMMILLILMGCQEKISPISLAGQWDLESITSIDEGLIAVGRASSKYHEFDGQQKDLIAIFSEEGTFTITGSEETMDGVYSDDDKRHSLDTIPIKMRFDYGIETLGVIGVRQYEDGKKVNSLTFTVDDKIYSFIQQTDD